MELDAARRTKKGGQTRARILNAATTLFRERGYEETTMRGIARAAGVSLGNTYYYFPSKESLIQAFYGQTHHDHLEAVEPVLAKEKKLDRRLRGVMKAKLDTIMPFHRFAGVLFRTAADPESPLNPFSEESSKVRGDATALFDEVVRGSDAKIPKQLEAELPELLWLYHMGVILYWVHDRSPGCRRTYALSETTVDLVVRIISLGSHPLLRPLLRSGLQVLAQLKEPDRATTSAKN